MKKSTYTPEQNQALDKLLEANEGLAKRQAVIDDLAVCLRFFGKQMHNSFRTKVKRDLDRIINQEGGY